jgi:hypothetical protein
MTARLPIDIDALNRFLESVGSYTVDLIFNPGVLQTIHHYTDLNGLQGIVSNHDLWLTHSRYSNDDEELTHGYEIVKEVIEEIQANGKISTKKKKYLTHVADILNIPMAEGVFICCFCEVDNLLSQWRSYGANGNGVSVGFKPDGFSYITGPDSPSSGLIRLWKVFYDRNTQKEIVRSALNFAFSDNTEPRLSAAIRAQKAADAIQFFIPTFKNQDFKDENEIRLIYTPLPGSTVKPQFRIARGMLVPYYSLKELDGSPTPRHLPIKSVRIGPSVNKQLNLESATMLLDKAGYTEVVVNSSDTPYRG